MSKRKNYVPNIRRLAAVITTLEGGKSSTKIGDVRQILKLIVDMDVKAMKLGMRTPLTMLRKIAIAKARGASA